MEIKCKMQPGQLRGRRPWNDPRVKLPVGPTIGIDTAASGLRNDCGFNSAFQFLAQIVRIRPPNVVD